MSEVLFERYHGIFGFVLAMFGSAALIAITIALVTFIIFCLAGALETLGLLPDRKTWWR